MLLNNLFSQASSGDGNVLGQYVHGFFGNNPKYLQANNSRYLLSAYPDMAPLVGSSSRQLSRYYEPISIDPIVNHGPINDVRRLNIFIDGDFIIAPIPHADNVNAGDSQGWSTHILKTSLDGGVTWRGGIPRSQLNTQEAQTFGLSINVNAIVIGAVKLPQSGHYGVALTTSNNNTSIVFATTTDFGANWSFISNIVAGPTVPLWDPLNVKLLSYNGVLIFISTSDARYSIDNGLNWVILDSANFRINPIGTEISPTGLMTIPTGTTNVATTGWLIQLPATAAGWNSSMTLNTFTLNFSFNRLKWVNDRWVAWQVMSGQTSGTFGHFSGSIVQGQTHNFTIRITATGEFVLDVVGFDNNIYYLVFGVGGIPKIVHWTNNGLAGNYTWLNDVPFLQLRSQVFGAIIGTNSGAYVQMGRVGIYRFVAITGANRCQRRYSEKPSLYAPQFTRKFDYWWCFVPHPGFAFNNSQAYTRGRGHGGHTGIDTTGVLLRSTDAINWDPVQSIHGGIVDAGTRLITANPSSLLIQTTDGINWSNLSNQPVKVTTPTQCRIWRVNDLIFCSTSQNYMSSSATVTLAVSTNLGSTWNTISSISRLGMVAPVKSSIAFYRGFYYCMSLFNNNDWSDTSQSAFNRCEIFRSQNGIDWTRVSTISFTTSSDNSIISGGLAVIGSNLFMCYGTSGFFTTNGFNWTTSSGLFLNTNMRDFDTSNGEMRFSYETSAQVGSVAQLSTHSYRNGILDFVIPTQIHSLGGDATELIAYGTAGIMRFNPQSAAFAVTAMPSPLNQFAYMKVAN